MYKISIVNNNVETHNYDGCVSMRVSDHGVVSCDFYEGTTKLYKMGDGDELVRFPMTEEEVMMTEGLGEWYEDQVQKAQLEALDEMEIPPEAVAS